MKRTTPSRMKTIGVVSVSFVLLTVLNAQQHQHEFPTERQINLLLTQAERALNVYADAVQLERQLAGGIESSDKDKQSLAMARDVLTTLKKNPSMGFNSPMGFLLVTNLDDASRNMAVCMGQGGTQAAAEMEEGKISSAAAKLHISRTCLDASTLLYTVSESALDLYANYLAAQYELSQQAAEGLQKCTALLKESQPERK